MLDHVLTFLEFPKISHQYEVWGLLGLVEAVWRNNGMKEKEKVGTSGTFNLPRICTWASSWDPPGGPLRPGNDLHSGRANRPNRGNECLSEGKETRNI